ncbi:MAG TPA: LuxR family transcriptional regulator [Casimicrobiaceae bacterium]|nr:LuxR family transcriptional regulator [Casimicrobiaceae bacterium]
MAFHSLELRGLRVPDTGTTPSLLAPLKEAAEQGRDLRPVVDAIVNSLGFDSVMYGLSTALRPGQDSLVFFFTNASLEWVRRYDQEAYIEVDPRIEHGVASTLPHMWDQSTDHGKSSRVDAFLRDAAGFGICSGVSFILPDTQRASVILCLNSNLRRIDDERRAMLVSNYGTMLMFGYYFHELFMRHVVDAGMPSHLQGAPLTARERQCLTMAACGLTTDDIAERLGIRPRTAQFHFDSIRTKLAVATRHEAIARAVQTRLITLS